MKKYMFLLILIIFISSCKQTEVVIEWNVVSEQGQNAEPPAGIRYKTFSIKTGEHRIFKKRDFIKTVTNVNADNLKLILNKDQKNRWKIDKKNVTKNNFETVLPENNKKQEYIKFKIPIIYKPYQVIFTDVVDGGLNREYVYENIKNISKNNDLYTYITNGLIKISTDNEKDCWKKIYTITETSLFNKIFDKIDNFYDELLVSEYYSEKKAFVVHLLISKYVYKFDYESLEKLNNRLNNYINIETKIYVPTLENEKTDSYTNLEITFVDTSERNIIKLFNK
ncbi:MAG: hypothetical protein U9N76_00745 [Candidatus Marinimicrobia bacterium]|nr:hypothetical protein [Candidatus Neomarinimicrobiota bacterium]